MDKAFLALLFFAMLVHGAFAVVTEDSMKIYAVTTEGEGLIATLHLEIEPGEGKIWSAVTPLVGTSTQNAEKTAIKVARDFSNKVSSYDYKFTIDSPASVVEGPSAGAAMALLAISMLTDRNVPDNISITGTISEDGGVGPVGGVFQKAKEASKTGTRLFLIPKGEAIQTVKLPEGVKSINLPDYAQKNFGVKVVEVETIDEAIKLANSKIEDIDVNSASQAVPEFIPEKLVLENSLGSFKNLVTNYIAEAKQVEGEARNALSSSLLEDPSVSHNLLEILNSSEQTLSRAEILGEQNYLYSAANLAFLARVNAITVKEVSANPKLLEQNSEAFDLRLLELKRELETFRNDLDTQAPKGGIEWFASAQQRYTYAKNAVDSLTKNQTVVVGGTKEDNQAQAFGRIQEYALAVAWLDVSKDFYNLAMESTELAQRPAAFANSMDRPIADTEQNIKKIGDNALVEDIARRIDSAKLEKDANWFEASYFDAVSARALSEAELVTKEKSHDELRKMLLERITSVEKALASDGSDGGWATLYLDHAKYYLASANYYDERSLPTSASDNLKSGIGLAILANEVFAASKEIRAEYASLPTSGISSGKAEGGNIKSIEIPGSFAPGFVWIAAILFLIALILVLVLLILGIVHSAGAKKNNAKNEYLPVAMGTEELAVFKAGKETKAKKPVAKQKPRRGKNGNGRKGTKGRALKKIAKAVKKKRK